MPACKYLKQCVFYVTVGFDTAAAANPYTYAGECGGSQRGAADLGRGFLLVCLAKLSRDEDNCKGDFQCRVAQRNDKIGAWLYMINDQFVVSDHRCHGARRIDLPCQRLQNR